MELRPLYLDSVSNNNKNNNNHHDNNDDNYTGKSTQNSNEW